MVNVESMLSILGLMHRLLGTCWSMLLLMSKLDQYFTIFCQSYEQGIYFNFDSKISLKCDEVF